MMKSKPVTHFRLVRNCVVAEGSTMEKLKSIVIFMMANRRVIGTIFGLSLTLCGYPLGEEVVNISERL
jgi:hypothetical protein